MEGKRDRDLEKPKKKGVGLPKYYSHVCFEKPAEYSDYSKSFNLVYGYCIFHFSRPSIETSRNTKSSGKLDEVAMRMCMKE